MMNSSDLSVRTRQPSITPREARGLRGGDAPPSSSGTTRGGSKVEVGSSGSGSDALSELSSRSRSDSRAEFARPRSGSFSDVVRPRSGSSSESSSEVGTASRRSSSSSEASSSASTSKSKSLVARFSGAVAAAPAKLAHGLKLLFNPDYRKAEYQLPSSGVRFNAADKGRGLGPYTVVKDKDKGVEPGFLAKKAWLPKDEANLSDPTHKFSQRATALLDGKLTVDLQNDGPLAAKAKAYLEAYHPDAVNLHGNPFDDAPTAQDFLADPGNKAIRDKLLDHLKENDKGTRDELRQGVMNNEKKFNKLHMIKLDYVETDMRKGFPSRDTLVRIPADKQKFRFHREFTAQTRESANRGAVRETMANDLMKEMGIHSQKLKLVPTQYQDGHPKLLLDGTFATGPNGGSFSDFDGHLRDGFMVKIDKVKTDAHQKHWKDVRDQHEVGSNQYKEADKQAKKTFPEVDGNGKFILNHEVNDLGRNKVLMLLLADRDALGSTGGNKGFADNTFIGIDPGHALEEKLLGKTGDVHSDFSFDQPSRIEKRGYKNLTMFDQQPLSEKMEGVRTIKAMRDAGSDTAIFDDYGDKFGAANAKGMDFSDEIGNRKQLYAQRRDDILGTFAERLAVDDFSFKNGASAADQKDLANKTLDILDNLEKLTSKTSGLSPKKDVQLERPRVTERREWHVAQNPDNSIKMSFTGSSRQARQAEAALTRFIDATPELKAAVDQGLVTVSRTGGELSFTITGDNVGARFLETVAQHLTNEAVMQHKHPH